MLEQVAFLLFGVVLGWAGDWFFARDQRRDSQRTQDEPNELKALLQEVERCLAESGFRIQIDRPPEAVSAETRAELPVDSSSLVDDLILNVVPPVVRIVPLSHDAELGTAATLLSPEERRR
jgi:hypothetical protein